MKPSLIQRHLGAGRAITQDGEIITVNTPGASLYLNDEKGNGFAPPQGVAQPVWIPAWGAPSMANVPWEIPTKHRIPMVMGGALCWKVSSTLLATSSVFYWDNESASVFLSFVAEAGYEYVLQFELVSSESMEWQNSRSSLSPDPFVSMEWSLRNLTNALNLGLRVRVVNPVDYPEFTLSGWVNTAQLSAVEEGARHENCVRWWTAVTVPFADAIVPIDSLPASHPIPSEFLYSPVSTSPVSVVSEKDALSLSFRWQPTGDIVTMDIFLRGSKGASVFTVPEGEPETWNVEFFTQQTWKDAGPYEDGTWEAALVAVRKGRQALDRDILTETNYGGWISGEDFLSEYETYVTTIEYPDKLAQFLSAPQYTVISQGSSVLYQGGDNPLSSAIVGVDTSGSHAIWYVAGSMGRDGFLTEYGTTPLSYTLPSGDGWVFRRNAFFPDWSDIDWSPLPFGVKYFGMYEGKYAYRMLLGWSGAYPIAGQVEVRLYTRPKSRKLILLPDDPTVGTNPFFPTDPPETLQHMQIAHADNTFNFTLGK